jgi:hypothetical protein
MRKRRTSRPDHGSTGSERDAVTLRLLADEDFDNDILDGLRRQIRELDVVRVQDVGLASASDPVILEWATQSGRILLTHDQNTMTGHLHSRLDAGLLVCRVCIVQQSAAIGQSIADLVLVIRSSESAQERAIARFRSPERMATWLAAEYAAAIAGTPLLINNNYIGTEHLLLGLIAEGEGLASKVLGEMGADLERTRREVYAMQDEGATGKLDPIAAAWTRVQEARNRLADAEAIYAEAVHAALRAAAAATAAANDTQRPAEASSPTAPAPSNTPCDPAEGKAAPEVSA